MEYFNQPHILPNLGRTYPLSIVSFVITSRTFGARIKLDNDQLDLWGQSDSNSEDISINPKTSNNDSDAVEQDLKISDLTLNDTSSVICIPNDVESSRGSVRGSRAHITVGVSSDVKPVQTGYDLIDLINLQSNIEPVNFEIPGGCLRKYAEDFWELWLNEKIVVNSIFAVKY